MTDQVYSMGQNTRKETGHDIEKQIPTLVPSLKDLDIVQVAAGYQMTIFLTSEGEVLEIGHYSQGGEPFLKHKIPEPIVKISACPYSLYALSSNGNVYNWRGWLSKTTDYPTGQDMIDSPRMIPFFSEKGLKVEEVVGSAFNSYFLCEGGELFGVGQAKG